MSQSTEIKVNVGLATIKQVYGSRKIAQHFNLHLIEGEDQREVCLTGEHFGYINSALQSYLREQPNDIVTKAMRDIIFSQFKNWEEIYGDEPEELREPFDLTFVVRLTS